MFKELKKDLEIIYCINANDIEKNKKIVIIGGSIIIVMGAIATSVVIRKRRSRLI